MVEVTQPMYSWWSEAWTKVKEWLALPPEPVPVPVPVRRPRRTR